ncbi:MAG: hypothetical protein EXR93_04835 [Gemmatimonadetes bacterium]|nr:hypothetical protein [Gemmatimonadota bacterium]
MRPQLLSILAAASVLLPPSLQAQGTGLFESDKPLPLRVSMDQKALMGERDSSKLKPQPATITYAGPDGQTVAIETQLSLRGHWRRQKANCEFAPIKVEFPKGKKDGTIFEDQGDLKLVTHCRNKDKDFEQYVLREYLVYKVYNILTPVSLRARLARVTYLDTGPKGDSLTKWGFFIENEKKIASRLKTKELELMGATWADVDPEQGALLSAFAYMIGGTDWALSALHNVLLYQDTTTGVVRPMLYDFDWTGLVNTKYSFPDYRLSIKTVRERIYRGICRRPEEWAPVIAQYQEKKAAIYGVYESLPDVDPKYVKDTRQYLDEFYALLGNPRRFKAEMIDTCKPA